MPLYEYECTRCQTTSHELRKVDERHRQSTCPKCGYHSELLISGNSMLDFKGDGFYKPGKDVGDK